MRRFFAVVVAVFTVALSGCAPDEPSPSVTIAPKWREIFDIELSDPGINDFVRDALSDYQITEEEYQESRSRFQQCMADRGWTVTFLERGYKVEGTTGGPHEHDNAFDAPVNDDGQCGDNSQSGKGSIGWLYLDMMFNPEGLTDTQTVRACFVKYGLPDGEGLTDDELEDLVIFNEDYYPSSPEAELCLLDPTGLNGASLEEAADIWRQRS